MRTTLTIEDEIAHSIERLRARERMSFREAVNRLLKAGLLAIESKPASRPYQGRTFDMGLEPGIDPNRLNQLADELEAEEFRG